MIRSCWWCWSRVIVCILLLNYKGNTSISVEIVVLFKNAVHRNAVNFLHYFFFIITHTRRLLSRNCSRFLRTVLFGGFRFLSFLDLNLLDLLLKWIFVFIVVAQFISDDGRRLAWEKNAFHAYWIAALWRRYNEGLFKLTCLIFFKIGRVGFYIKYYNKML